MIKFKVCSVEKRDCKGFDSYEELIEWANEKKRKSEEIKVGDIVTIENYGQMYTTLDETYFEELCTQTAIESKEIYKIMIHYDYNCFYGVGHNPNKVEDRIKWKVVFIYGDRVFIERQDYIIKKGQILCVNKRGLEKSKEV